MEMEMIFISLGIFMEMEMVFISLGIFMEMEMVYLSEALSYFWKWAVHTRGGLILLVIFQEIDPNI